MLDDKIRKLAFYDQQVKKSSFHDIDRKASRKVKARSQSDKCSIILLREDRMKIKMRRKNTVAHSDKYTYICMRFQEIQCSGLSQAQNC